MGRRFKMVLLSNENKILRSSHSQTLTLNTTSPHSQVLKPMNKPKLQKTLKSLFPDIKEEQLI